MHHFKYDSNGFADLENLGKDTEIMIFCQPGVVMINHSINGFRKNLRHRSRKFAQMGISSLFYFWEHVKNDSLGVSEKNETTQIGSWEGGGVLEKAY